jgi:hypothetical protein
MPGPKTISSSRSFFIPAHQKGGSSRVMEYWEKVCDEIMTRKIKSRVIRCMFIALRVKD